MESLRHLGTVTNLEFLRKLKANKPKSRQEACLQVAFAMCAVAADKQRHRWNMKKNVAFSLATLIGAMLYESVTGNKSAFSCGKVKGRTLHKLARDLKAQYERILPEFSYTAISLQVAKQYGLAETEHFSQTWAWEGAKDLLSSISQEVEITLGAQDWGIDVMGMLDLRPQEESIEVKVTSKVIANVGGQMVCITPLEGEDPDLLDKMFKGDFKFNHYRRVMVPVINGKEVDIRINLNNVSPLKLRSRA